MRPIPGLRRSEPLQLVATRFNTTSSLVHVQLACWVLSNLVDVCKPMHVMPGRKSFVGLPSGKMIAISTHDAVRHCGCSPVLACLSAGHLQTEQQQLTHTTQTLSCKLYSIKQCLQILPQSQLHQSQLHQKYHQTHPTHTIATHPISKKSPQSLPNSTKILLHWASFPWARTAFCGICRRIAPFSMPLHWVRDLWGHSWTACLQTTARSRQNLRILMDRTRRMMRCGIPIQGYCRDLWARNRRRGRWRVYRRISSSLFMFRVLQ